jgi:Fe-S oxidoreductase
MATYRAEFLSHYYEKKARPLAAHVFGRIDALAKYASRLPHAANFFSHRQPFAAIAKKVLGVAPQRELVTFAPQSFTDWFRARGGARPGSERVILWPDTFNNYFTPATARAALEALERAGYSVHVPRIHLCCGRPLYEWGMLDRAKAYLSRVMEALDGEIRAGTPIVALEPACASVFREELPNLFASDEQAMRLSRLVQLFSEFVARNEKRFSFPRLERRAVVHAHCHHKAVLGTSAYRHVLTKLGLDCTFLDSGCCGMAGSFGFEADKFEVSMKCGERVLLPAVRSAEASTLIVANGFSCREQIRQSTGRRALHVADVFALAADAR